MTGQLPRILFALEQHTTLTRGIWRFTSRNSSIETYYRESVPDSVVLCSIRGFSILSVLKRFLSSSFAACRRPCSGRVQRFRRAHKHVIFVCLMFILRVKTQSARDPQWRNSREKNHREHPIKKLACQSTEGLSATQNGWVVAESFSALATMSPDWLRLA